MWIASGETTALWCPHVNSTKTLRFHLEQRLSSNKVLTWPGRKSQGSLMVLCKKIIKCLFEVLKKASKTYLSSQFHEEHFKIGLPRTSGEGFLDLDSNFVLLDFPK